MKHAVFLLLSFALLIPAVAAQDVASTDSTMSDSTKATYHVFTGDGQPSSIEAIVSAMEDVDVVFVGEQHDDPIGHQLEALLLVNAYRASQQNTARTRPVAVSLEMFQRDVQPIVDEYLADLITESHFRKSTRPWHNYQTDYRPLVEFAKAHRLPVIAANAPRRYANRLSRLGPDSLGVLSAWAKAWLPPAPYPKPSEVYKAKWDKLMAKMMSDMMAKKEENVAADSSDSDPAMEAPESEEMEEKPMEEVKKKAEHPMPTGPNFMIDGQAFWDANMAYSIHQHLEKTPDALVLHMVGSFHVEEGLGTPAQLEGYHPGVRHLVVILIADEDFETFDAEAHSLGDFVILTDESLPRSYE